MAAAVPHDPHDRCSTEHVQTAAAARSARAPALPRIKILECKLKIKVALDEGKVG